MDNEQQAGEDYNAMLAYEAQLEPEERLGNPYYQARERRKHQQVETKNTSQNVWSSILGVPIKHRVK